MKDKETQDAALQKRHDYMTKTPIAKLVLQLAAPSIVSMLVTSLYNMADTFFVGRISTQASSAVGVVFSLMALIQSLGFFCGHGSGNYMSRKLGQGDIKEANTIAATGFVLAFCIGLVICIASLCLIRPLAIILGATKTNLQDTKDYMRIILIGAPFMMSSLVLNNQLRFQGSAAYSMVGLVTGALVNIILDPILIFTCNLQIAGAALATIISQTISFLLLWQGTRHGPNVRITIKKAKFNLHFITEIINGGAPSLFRQGMACIAVIILNKTAGNMAGDAAIAGMSIATRAMMAFNSALIGFGQGFQPVCSYNYGARKTQRVVSAFWFCTKWGAVFLTIVSVVCFARTRQIIAFFCNDEAVIAVGRVALRLQLITFPLGAFTIMSNMMLQSIGRGVKASIMASAKSAICFLPFILTLPYFLGLLGIEMSQMCADFCAFLLALPLTLPELHSMKKLDT